MKLARPRPRGGFRSRIDEVRDLMFTPGVPAAYKGPARAFALAIRSGKTRSGVLFDRLLAAAVAHARAAVARDLLAARGVAGLTRRDLGRLVGRSPRYVGRVERGEAAIDLEYRAAALRVCAGKRRGGRR